MDRQTNDRADEQAKIAATATRAPVEIKQDYDDYRQNVLDASAWLGMVTWLAGNLSGPVKRDTGASALKALQHKGTVGQNRSKQDRDYKYLVNHSKVEELTTHEPLLSST